MIPELTIPISYLPVHTLPISRTPGPPPIPISRTEPMYIKIASQNNV